MRRSLSSFVAMLCLLTLFVSSAACMALPQDALAATITQHEHVVNAPEHACCPQRSPAGEHASTTCCTVHHQPVSASSFAEIEQPAVISHALPVPVLVAATLHPPTSRMIVRPEQPPSVPLRI